VYVENIERNTVAFRESIDRFTKRRVLIPKPYFTLNDGALVLHHVPVPIDRPFVGESTEREVQSLDRKDADPLQTLIYKPLQRVKGHKGLEAVRAGVKKHLPWLMPAVLKRTGYQPRPDYLSPATEGWRLMRAILTRFTQASAPTPVLIVPVP